MAPAFPLASKQPEFLASGAILFFSSRAYQSSKVHALEADLLSTSIPKPIPDLS
jgi:hypothetical protein